MSEWMKKDIWTQRSGKFCVEVSRHTVLPSPYDPSEGVNRWAVYAYIYENHRLFEKFDGTGIFQEVTSCMPLHGGCSYLQAHRDESGTVKSYQVGADYHHYMDDFTHAECKEDAYRVFNDAQDLFDFLSDSEK